MAEVADPHPETYEPHRHPKDERVASDQPRHGRSWYLRVGVPLAFFLAALVLYSVGLGHPDAVVFDEVHYLGAARAFADADWMNEDWGDDRPHNWEHPPLGKYWMALMIEVFGDEDPEHYRLPSVLYGAAGVAGLSVLAFRLFRSEVAAVLAPLLLLAEPMWYVHSRLAVLEIFVAAPMIWAFAFALGRREWEPWAAAGAASLALAAKYSALFLFPPLFLMLLWRRVGVARPGAPFRMWEVFRAFVLTFIVPLLFVVVTWAPFLKEWAGRRGIVYAFDHTWFLFKESLTWGQGGPMEHAEATAPLYWIPMVRPTWYWVHWGTGEGLDQQVGLIYAIGNPFIWWGALLLAVLLLARPALRGLSALRLADKDQMSLRVRLSRNDWAVIASVGVALFVFVAGYAPFFLLSRIAFLYYMALLVPYLALLLAGCLAWILVRTEENEVARRAAIAAGDLQPRRSDPEVQAPAWGMLLDRWDLLASNRWTGRALACFFVVGAIAIAIYWIPLYTGLVVERTWVENAWDLVPWFERLIGDVSPPSD